MRLGDYVVGVDCGGSRLHAVMIDPNDLSVVRVECFSSKSKDRNEVLRSARNWIDDRPHIFGSEVWVEAAILAGVRNIQSTIRIAEMVGVVLSSANNVRQVAVSQWKKATVGKGNVCKEEVSDWLLHHHKSSYDACEGSQDFIDATCIALYGAGEREKRVSP